MRRLRVAFACGAFGIALVLLGVPASKSPGQEAGAEVEVDELLRQADAAFAQNYDEARLREAIALYEQVLSHDPENRHALDRLAQAYYELAFAHRFVFLPPARREDREVREERRELFSRGREYGLRSLRTWAGFAAQEDRNFEQAVRAVEDVAALSWTAADWGRVLEFEGLSLRALEEVPKIRALYERALELDPLYFASAPKRGLGALLANLPGFLGGDLERAQRLLEEAVADAPEFLENRVRLACEVALKRRDRETFTRELQTVLAHPIGEAYILWNRVAHREAQELLEMADRLFRPTLASPRCPF